MAETLSGATMRPSGTRSFSRRRFRVTAGVSGHQPGCLFRSDERAYITAGDEEEWTRERATVIDVTPEK
jgi:hypothetical protein